MNHILQKINELGYKLPEVTKPIANYEPFVQVNDLIFTSGALPLEEGNIKYKGKIGSFSNTCDNGVEASKLCMLNALSILNNAVGLDNIKKIVKLTGYVNSASTFTEQPKVLNGASDLLVEIFGDIGKHARTAIGVAELPLDASVEIDLIVQV